MIDAKCPWCGWPVAVQMDALEAMEIRVCCMHCEQWFKIMVQILKQVGGERHGQPKY